MLATHQSTPHIHYLPLTNIRGLLPPMPVSHEAFIHAIRDVGLARLNEQDAARLKAVKITYGTAENVRGICYSGAWKNGTNHDLICISAIGEESGLQVSGTTLHELAHALAGCDAGHGRQWKQACHQLGLAHAEAAGQAYALEHFDIDVQQAINSLTHPNDGRPVFAYSGALPIAKLRPCSAGVGTRGGKSRGKGSGSRLRRYVCDCGQIVRAATDELRATCDLCNSAFTRSDVGGAQ